jgi:type II secretory pathway component PulJ
MNSKNRRTFVLIELVIALALVDVFLLLIWFFLRG